MITNEEIIKKYNESIELIKNNNFVESREILERLIIEIDTIENETENDIFYTFDNAIEFVSLIIFFKLNENKNAKWIKNVYSKIYMEYSKTLLNNDALEMAKTIIDKSILWNPISSKSYYVKAKIFLKQDNIQKYLELINIGGQRALTLREVAEYFDYLGTYYEKNGEIDLAISIYIVSKFYCETARVNRKIEKIKVKQAEEYNLLQIDDAFKILEENEIKILPNMELLTRLYDFANSEYDKEKTNFALLKQIYELLDNFLDKDDIKDKTIKINNILNIKGEEKKVLIVSNSHMNNKNISIENKITDRLQIKNQIILSSVNEVIKILINISKEIHNVIFVRDIKEVLNLLMMNNEKTFLKEYPNLDESIQNSVHQYYNMDEKAQKEIMTEILFGFRKLRDDEIIE